LTTATLPTLYLSDTSAACLQDFETTIQSYVTPSHLLGVLNFSVLWNPVTYIYDTAIGDSPHIIDSFLSKPGSNKRALYMAVKALIEAGALRVLVRQHVQVDGKTLFEHPRISQVYAGWRIRDKESTANFQAQHFGDARDSYNRVIDRLLDESYLAIKYYDPNTAKPGFRAIVQRRLDSDDDFRQLVFQLPFKVREQYLRTCADNHSMTTVDLWRLVNPLASTNVAASKLVHALGFINQQAIATSVAAGISGSDWGHGYRPTFLKRRALNPTTPEEILEQADLTLEAPALELLGRLAPTDVVKLRQFAEKTIFSLATPTTVSPDRLRSAVVSVMREYWGRVCSHVDAQYPNHTQRKVKIYAYVDRNIPTFKRWYRQSGLMRDTVEIAAKLAIKQDPTGTAPIAQGLMKRAAVFILYTPSEEFRSLRDLKSSLWTPRAAWSNEREDQHE
jgi:hypothetical protein